MYIQEALIKSQKVRLPTYESDGYIYYNDNIDEFVNSDNEIVRFTQNEIMLDTWEPYFEPKLDEERRSDKGHVLINGEMISVDELAQLHANSKERKWKKWPDEKPKRSSCLVVSQKIIICDNNDLEGYAFALATYYFYEDFLEIDGFQVKPKIWCKIPKYAGELNDKKD